MRQRRSRHVHAQLCHRLLGLRHARRVRLASDVHRRIGGSEVRVQCRPGVHERYECVHEIVDGGRLPGRCPGLLLRTEFFVVRRNDTRVPLGLVRSVYAPEHAVLRQWNSDVLVERPVGQPSSVRCERDVHHQRRSGGVHLRVVNLRGRGHGVREQPNARDMRCRHEQVQLHQLRHDMLEQPIVFRQGSECFVLIHMHEQLRSGPNVVRQWQPRYVHAAIRWRSMLVVRHWNALWSAPVLYGQLGHGRVHMQSRRCVYEQCERVQDLDDARQLRRGYQQLLL